jgi:hypothetical protein
MNRLEPKPPKIPVVTTASGADENAIWNERKTAGLRITEGVPSPELVSNME